MYINSDKRERKVDLMKMEVPDLEGEEQIANYLLVFTVRNEYGLLISRFTVVDKKPVFFKCSMNSL